MPPHSSQSASLTSTRICPDIARQSSQRTRQESRYGRARCVRARTGEVARLSTHTPGRTLSPCIKSSGRSFMCSSCKAPHCSQPSKRPPRGLRHARRSKKHSDHAGPSGSPELRTLRCMSTSRMDRAVPASGAGSEMLSSFWLPNSSSSPPLCKPTQRRTTPEPASERESKGTGEAEHGEARGCSSAGDHTRIRP